MSISSEDSLARIADALEEILDLIGCKDITGDTTVIEAIHQAGRVSHEVLDSYYAKGKK